jgi:hypothetical protein
VNIRMWKNKLSCSWATSSYHCVTDESRRTSKIPLNTPGMKSGCLAKTLKAVSLMVSESSIPHNQQHL